MTPKISSPIRIKKKGAAPPQQPAFTVAQPAQAASFPQAATNGNGAAPAASAPAVGKKGAPQPQASVVSTAKIVDLERRRGQLAARVAELQWDLGGLFYEMAVRNRIHLEVLVKRAALLQDADAELSEVERILRMEQTGVADSCKNCGAPHSSGAVYCWQCGQPLLEQVSSSSITAP